MGWTQTIPDNQLVFARVVLKVLTIKDISINIHVYVVTTDDVEITCGAIC